MIALTPTPLPSPPAQTKAGGRGRLIEADRLCAALCTKIHEPIIHMVQINKGNWYFFLAICRKKVLENTDLHLPKLL